MNVDYQFDSSLPVGSSPYNNPNGATNNSYLMVNPFLTNTAIAPAQTVDNDEILKNSYEQIEKFFIQFLDSKITNFKVNQILKGMVGLRSTIQNAQHTKNGRQIIIFNSFNVLASNHWIFHQAKNKRFEKVVDFLKEIFLKQGIYEYCGNDNDERIYLLFIILIQRKKIIDLCQFIEILVDKGTNFLNKPFVKGEKSLNLINLIAAHSAFPEKEMNISLEPLGIVLNYSEGLAYNLREEKDCKEELQETFVQPSGAQPLSLSRKRAKKNEVFKPSKKVKTDEFDSKKSPSKKINFVKITQDIEPLEFPISEVLNELPSEFPIQTMHHPFLKEYQRYEASQLVSFAKVGISKLLCFEMGLGKTYVYSEFLAHMVELNPFSKHLILVPKSLLNSVYDEVKKYYTEVCAEAWLVSWNQMEPHSNKKSYFEEFSWYFFRESTTRTALLRPLSHILKERHYFTSICECFKNTKFLTQKYFPWEEISTEVERRLITLYNIFKNDSEKYTSLLEELKRTLIHFIKFFPLDYQDDALEFAKDRTPLENLLASGNIAALPFWKMKNDNQIESSIALAALAGSLLELFSERSESFSETKNLNFWKNFSIADQFEMSEDPKQIENLFINDSNKAQFIFSTHSKIQKIPTDIINKNLGSLIVDEAQKAHNLDSNLFRWLYATSKKMKQNGSPLLLVTGTPLENNLLELCNLLSLANPGSFSLDVGNILTNQIDSVVALLTHCELEKIEYLIVQAFKNLEKFRSQVAVRLANRICKENDKVIQDWHGRLSKRKDKEIKIEFSPILQSEFDNIYKTKDLFASNVIIKSRLLGISGCLTFQGSDPSVQKVKTIFSGTNDLLKENFIKNSPILNSLFDHKSFQSVFTKKQFVIIATEHLVVAEITELALKYKFAYSNVQTQFFHGKLNVEERQKIIKWCKELSASPKILLLMQKSGGVGLNLPEARKLFQISINFNPCVDDQAIMRIIRVGNEGARTIFSLSYDILLHEHYKIIQGKKRDLVNFIFSQSNDIKKQFRLFCDILEKTILQRNLNETRDLQASEEELKPIIDSLNSLNQNLNFEEIAQAVYPAVQQQDIIMKDVSYEQHLEQPKKEAAKAIQTINPTARNQKLNKSDWQILPIPSINLGESIKWERALKFINKKDISYSLELVSQKPAWNAIAREGIQNVLEHTQKNKYNPLAKVFNDIQPYLLKEIQEDFAIEIYNFQNNQYCLIEESENLNKKDIIRLYKASSFNSNGSPHYDLLLNLAEWK